MCFVSTIADQPSVEPYLFCNYQHHPNRRQAAAHYQRSSDVQCWEAIMASTAAPGFFEEVKLHKHLFLVSMCLLRYSISVGWCVRFEYLVA